MKPREIVLAQIQHRETGVIPYTLPMDASVGEKLDAYYGGPDWRKRMTSFIVGVNAVDTDPKQVIDDTYVRDGYGGIWRQDMRPWHLEKPPLAEPTSRGMCFRRPNRFSVRTGRRRPGRPVQHPGTVS